MTLYAAKHQIIQSYSHPEEDHLSAQYNCKLLRYHHMLTQLRSTLTLNSRIQAVESLLFKQPTLSPSLDTDLYFDSIINGIHCIVLLY